MNEIILDTETTGLSVEKGDRILEIACIETKNLIPTNNVFHKLLNPEREVSDDAFKIHGYSYDKLKSEKKFEEIADEFLNFIKGKEIIIHNAQFDLSFLNNELKKISWAPIEAINVIDGTIISSPFFMFKANNERCKALVPLFTATQYLALKYLPN